MITLSKINFEKYYSILLVAIVSAISFSSYFYWGLDIEEIGEYQSQISILAIFNIFALFSSEKLIIRSKINFQSSLNIFILIYLATLPLVYLFYKYILTVYLFTFFSGLLVILSEKHRSDGKVVLWSNYQAISRLVILVPLIYKVPSIFIYLIFIIALILLTINMRKEMSINIIDRFAILTTDGLQSMIPHTLVALILYNLNSSELKGEFSQFLKIGNVFLILISLPNGYYITKINSLHISSKAVIFDYIKYAVAIFSVTVMYVLLSNESWFIVLLSFIALIGGIIGPFGTMLIVRGNYRRYISMVLISFIAVLLLIYAINLIARKPEYFALVYFTFFMLTSIQYYFFDRDT